MPVWDEQHIRGDDRSIPFRVTSQTSGSAINLTGAEVRFTVKERFEDTYAQAKIAKANAAAGGGAAEIAMTDPTDGRGTVYLIPADTSELNATTQLSFDLQVVVGGKRYTVKRSTMTLLAGVTELAT